MNIRVTKIEDAIQIDELLRQLGYAANNNSFVKHQIEKSTVANNMGIFIAEDNNIIIGFLSVGILPLFHVDENLGRITALCVHEKHRRKGIGNKLLTMAEEYFTNNNCKRIEVTSGNREERKAAHAFYIRNGYDEVNDSKLFRKNP